MLTRSDQIIYDETGCLYMSGVKEVLYKEKELSPIDENSIGTPLKVKAIVRLIDGKPILSDK